MFQRASGGEAAVHAAATAFTEDAPSPAPLQRWPKGHTFRELTRWDALGMAAGFLFTLLITLVLSRGRLFWEDEMLGWMLLRDPSWTHMVSAWRLGADGGGFLFYLTGRAWLHLFGTSEMAFRLYTSVCFGLALAVVWVAARRFYSIGSVAFAVVNTFFFSRPFVAHFREGRFYGLLVLEVALGLWLAFALADVPKPTRPRWFVALFLVHASLVTSHPLGIVFSAFLLATTAVLDHLAGRLRPLLYLAGVASWLLLLPERANMAASAAVGQPHFWIGRPTVLYILAVYTGLSNEIVLVLLGILALLLWSRHRGPSLRAAMRAAWAERTSAYVATAALLLIPIAFLLQGGLSGHWLFSDRYLLPVTLTLVFVTAEGLALLRAQNVLAQVERFRLPAGFPFAADDSFAAIFRFAAGAALALYPALLLFWDFHHVAEFTPSSLDYTAALTAKLPPSAAVVCEDVVSFTDLIGRQHSSDVHYTFLLDWPQALSPKAPPLEVTQFHLMENWRKVGYFAGSIQPIREFLAHNPRFYVLHAVALPRSSDPPGVGNPLVERFQHDPRFEVRPYAVLERRWVRDEIWLVCWGSCNHNALPATALPAEPPLK